MNDVSRRRARSERAVARRLLVATLTALAFAGCDTPSSHVDGGELHGVFEHDASADGSARPAASAGALRGKRDAGGAHRLPALRRPPVPGPCVRASTQALPEAPKSRPGERPARRPACRGARVLEWRDAARNPRYACVTGPREAAERAPLPLLLFLHGEYDTPRAVGRKTGLRKRNEKADLTGDPQRRGFLILAPQGRRMQGKLQFSTVPASPDNIDVQTIDHFFDVLQGEGLVDRRRVYAVGDSEGARMAQLYAYLRPDRIAAVGLYGGFASDLAWSCAATPPPTMVIYRACDAVTPCAEVERWLEQQSGREQTLVGLRLGAANSAEPNCTLAKRCRRTAGQANHHRWPKRREPELLEFLGRYQLEVTP